MWRAAISETPTSVTPSNFHHPPPPLLLILLSFMGQWFLPSLISTGARICGRQDDAGFRRYFVVVFFFSKVLCTSEIVCATLYTGCKTSLQNTQDAIVPFVRSEKSLSNRLCPRLYPMSRAVFSSYEGQETTPLVRTSDCIVLHVKAGLVL